MIQAKDLRIGNYIRINNPEYRPKDTGKIATVSHLVDRGGYSIGCHINEDEDYGQLEEYIEPIPLTEEWLLKAGFEKQKWTDKGVLIAIVWGHNTNDNMPLLDEDLRIDGTDSNPLKHVHQLQNLYYALTGQELEFTP